MKTIISVSFIILVLLSCSKKSDQNQDIQKVDTSYCPASIDPVPCTGSLCQSDTCQTYFAIWKSRFLERNQMSQDYFNAHITLCKSQLHNWVDGISYEITYKVKIDWAESVLTDKFAIWLSKTTAGLYPSLEVPRNALLSSDQINALFSLQAFSSALYTVAPVVHLKYLTATDAMKALITAAKVDTLCTAVVFFQSPNIVSPPVGNPHIEASGVLDWNQNKCITGSLDLVTGMSDVFRNVCVVNN